MAGLHDISPMVSPLVGQQQGARACARGSRRSFAAGVPAADHDDVVPVHGRSLTAQRPAWQELAMFHVKHLPPNRGRP